jgi:hypothetical protein
MGENGCPDHGEMVTERGIMVGIAPQDTKIMRSLVKTTH